MPGVNRSKVRMQARAGQPASYASCMHYIHYTWRHWLGAARPRPSNRAGHWGMGAGSPATPRPPAMLPSGRGSRGRPGSGARGRQHEPGEIVEQRRGACMRMRCAFVALFRDSPAFCKGAHTDWTCAWKTTRAGQGPSHPGGWMHGGPAKFACYCYCYASGDDEMGRAWWTGGAARAPCPSRGVPPMGHRAGGRSRRVLYPAASSGRPGQGPLGHRAFFLLFITVENECSLSLCWFGHAVHAYYK